MFTSYEISLLGHSMEFEIESKIAKFFPKCPRLFDLNVDCTVVKIEPAKALLRIEIGSPSIAFSDDLETITLPETPALIGKWLDYVVSLHAICLLQRNGYGVLHASAVNTEKGVIAFFGPKESGKTTVVRTLALHGFRVLANDTILIRLEDQKEMFVSGDRFFDIKERFEGKGDVQIRREPLVLGMPNPAALYRIFRIVLDSRDANLQRKANISEQIELAASLAPFGRGGAVSLFDGTRPILDLQSRMIDENRAIQLANSVTSKLRFLSGDLMFIENNVCQNV